MIYFSHVNCDDYVKTILLMELQKRHLDTTNTDLQSNWFIFLMFCLVADSNRLK